MWRIAFWFLQTLYHLWCLGTVTGKQRVKWPIPLMDFNVFLWLPHCQAYFFFLKWQCHLLQLLFSPVISIIAHSTKNYFFDSSCLFQSWRMKHFKHLKIIWPLATWILCEILILSHVVLDGPDLFIIYFLAVLGLRFCARAFSSCGKWRPLFIAVRGPLTIAAASLVVEHRLQTRRLSSCGSRA